MRFIFALHCICLIATFANAGVPLPQPGDPQNNLSKNCQIPKCPETKIVGGEEEVVALPYPLDCLQYVECRGSQSRVLPCPPDEVFDKTTSSCGSRYQVHCIPCYQEAPYSTT